LLVLTSTIYQIYMILRPPKLLLFESWQSHYENFPSTSQTFNIMEGTPNNLDQYKYNFKYGDDKYSMLETMKFNKSVMTMTAPESDWFLL